MKKKKIFPFNKLQDRVITTGDNFAYVKIADGCNNCCTFCAIPYIRGRFESRPMEDIIDEVKKLAKSGYKRNNINSSRYNKIRNRHIWEAKACRIIKKIMQNRRNKVD